MDLKLNFVGLMVADFDAALRFYTETLGMVTRYRKPDWAYFETTGAIFEMFGGATHSGGPLHSVIPCLSISDFEATVASLRANGVRVVDSGAGDGSVLLVAPEDLVWKLAPDTSAEAHDSTRPRITEFILRCGNFAAQRRFFAEIMGMQSTETDSDWEVFTQQEDLPTLVLFTGGTPHPAIRNRLEVPHYLSFETTDIEQAAETLRAKNANFIQDVTPEPWGGIDLYILDADNNPIEVVQYLHGEN